MITINFYCYDYLPEFYMKTYSTFFKFKFNKMLYSLYLILY